MNLRHIINFQFRFSFFLYICLLPLSSIIFVLIDLSCSGRSSPIWIEKPYSLYDEKRFIVGVGSGISKEMADDSARLEVMKQMKMKITEKFREILTEETKGKFSFQSEKVERTAESEISGEIEGMLIKERFYEKKEQRWYSLAVFDKSLFSKKIKREIADTESQILLGMKQAKEFLDVGDVVSAVRVLEKQEKLADLISAKILILLSLGENYQSIFKSLFDKLIYDLSSVRISAEGEKQYSSPLTPVSFRVRIMYNGIPVRNFPISVKVKGLFSENKFSFVSGEDGYAKVRFLHPLRIGENTIYIEPSLPYIETQAVFQVSVKPATLLIKGDEKTTNIVAECLSKKGFYISSLDEKKGYDFVVKPELTAKIVHEGKDFSGNRIFISSAELSITFLKDEDVIYSEKFSSKYSSRNKDEAIAGALNSLIKNFCSSAN